MLLGIMADTHDNLPKVSAACAVFREHGVETIVHAGDFVAPFVLKVIARSGMPLVAVFGNNDGEGAGLRAACDGIQDPPRRCTLGGRKVVIAHDPAELAGPVLEGADLLVHGHTHEAYVDIGPPMTVNPGEVGGWLTGRSTVAVVDSDSMTAELIEIGSQETVAL